MVRALAFLAHCRVPSTVEDNELDYDALARQCLETLQSPAIANLKRGADKQTQSLASHTLSILSRIDAASHPLWPSADNASELRQQCVWSNLLLDAINYSVTLFRIFFLSLSDCASLCAPVCLQ